MTKSKYNYDKMTPNQITKELEKWSTRLKEEMKQLEWEANYLKVYLINKQVQALAEQDNLDFMRAKIQNPNLTAEEWTTEQLKKNE